MPKGEGADEALLEGRKELKNEALESRFGSLIAGFLVIALTKNGKNR